MYNSNWETTNWQYAQSQVSKLQYRIYKHKKILKKHYLQRVLLNSLSTKLLISELTFKQYRQNVSDRERDKITTRMCTTDPNNNLFNIKSASKLTAILNSIKERLIFYIVVPNWYTIFELKTLTPLYQASHHTTIKEIKRTLLKTRSRYAIQVSVSITTIIGSNTQSYGLKELNISPVISNFIVPYLHYLRKKIDCKLYREGSNPEEKVLSYYRPFKNLLLEVVTNDLKKTLLHLSDKLGLKQGIKIIIIPGTDEIFLFHIDIKALRKMLPLIPKLLKINHNLALPTNSVNMIDLVQGISLYKFKICLRITNRNLLVFIHPDENSQRSYLKKFSKISHQNRNVSTYVLITLLRPMILQWATYFQYYDCKETFYLLNYKSNQILRAWVFRRDRRNGRNLVKENHFPSGNIYKFPDINHKNNWVLCGTMNKNSDKKLFLPQLQWLPVLK